MENFATVREGGLEEKQRGNFQRGRCENHRGTGADSGSFVLVQQDSLCADPCGRHLPGCS